MVSVGYKLYSPIVAIFIWPGWALVEVNDKYLFREKSGVQYVGRCASSLDQLKN